MLRKKYEQQKEQQTLISWLQIPLSCHNTVYASCVIDLLL